MSLKHLIVMNKYISHLPPFLTILAAKSCHSGFYDLPVKVLRSLPAGVVSGKVLLCRAVVQECFHFIVCTLCQAQGDRR